MLTQTATAFLLVLLTACVVCAQQAPFSILYSFDTPDAVPFDTTAGPLNVREQARLISCNCTGDFAGHCETIPDEVLEYRDGYYATRTNARVTTQRVDDTFAPRYLNGAICDVTTSVIGNSNGVASIRRSRCGTTCEVVSHYNEFKPPHALIVDADTGAIVRKSTMETQCPFTYWPSDARCGPITLPVDGSNTTFATHKYCCGTVDGAVPTAGAFGYPCGCAENVPCWDCGAYPEVPWHDRLFTQAALTTRGYDSHPMTTLNDSADRCEYQPFVATAAGQTEYYDNCALDEFGARWCCAIGDGRDPVFDTSAEYATLPWGYCLCSNNAASAEADGGHYPCDYCGTPNNVFGGDYPDAYYAAYPARTRPPAGAAPEYPPPINAEPGDVPAATSATGRAAPFAANPIRFFWPETKKDRAA